MGALTTKLLSFSRRQIRQPRSHDLNAGMANLERMLIGTAMDAAMRARIFEPFFTTRWVWRAS